MDVKALLSLSVVAAALQPTAAPTQGAWSPTTKWVVRFDEDKCAAIREYGRGAERLKIDVEPTVMQEQWSLNIEAPESVTHLKTMADTSLIVGAKAVPDALIWAGVSTRKGYTVYSTFLNGLPLQHLKQSGSVTLRTQQSSYTIPLTDLELLTKTLDVCMVDLLDTWGFSKQEQARLGSPPKAIGGRISFSHEDYPRRAIALNASGSVRFRLTVGADGRVKDCRILKSSGNMDLDMASCRVARRTRFEPARDRSGQPMEAPFFSRVRWFLA